MATASALLLALAGCTADGDDDPSVTPTPTARDVVATVEAQPQPTPTSVVDITVSASPSPRETSLPAVDPETGAWLVSAAGIGPVELGEPFEAHLDHVPDDARQDIDRCDALFMSTWEDPRSEGWRMVGSGAPEDERVIRTLVVSDNGTAPATATTAEGVGLDSTAEDVLAAYPDARRTQDDILDSPPPYNLVVDQEGVPIAFRVDSETDEVRAIAVGAETFPWEYCG